MTPEAAHGVFDGPGCVKATLKAHMQRLVDEQWVDASMSLLPNRVRVIYGPPNVYPPYGFRMQLELTWYDPFTQTDVDNFNFCLTLSETDRVGDNHLYAVDLEPF